MHFTSFFSFFFLRVTCVTVNFSLSHCSFPSTVLLRTPPPTQLLNLTLCYGYEGEDEVSGNILLRLNLLAPNICKSCLANQNCLSNHLTLNSPDKEMFMPFFFLFFFKRSLPPQVWGWTNLSPTLDYEVSTLAFMGMCAALFVLYHMAIVCSSEQPAYSEENMLT